MTSEATTVATGDHPMKVVVLASGSGTLLQAVLDAMSPDGPYQVVAVGSDVADCTALERAENAGIPTFLAPLREHPTRADWDQALGATCVEYGADLVVLAGFMKLVGEHFLDALPGRVINAHPSLLPSFPGMHAPADALAHGVKVTGCTVFIVDTGVDAGPIVDQRTVPVLADDSVESLHERIKTTERELLVDVVENMTGRGWQIDGRLVSYGPPRSR